MTDALSALTLSGWWSAVAGMTLAAGAVLLVVLAADLLLARRVSARWRAALYLAVLVRLALPADWTSPAGVLPREPAPVTVVSSGLASAPSAAPRSMTIVPASPPAAPVRWGLLLQLGVTALLAGAWLVLRRREGALLRDASAPSPRLAALAPGLPIVEHASCGPAVQGLLRPRIVVPRALATTLDDDALRAILRHEAAHLSRRDPLLLAFVQAATFACWPLLPAWIAAWRVRGLMEQACDEAALRDAGRDQRRAYAEALLAVAEWSPHGPRLQPGMLAFGGGLASRLRALRFRRRWPLAAQAILVASLAIVTVLACGGRAGADPATVEPEQALAAAERAAEDGRAVDASALFESLAGRGGDREAESMARVLAAAALARLAGPAPDPAGAAFLHDGAVAIGEGATLTTPEALVARPRLRDAEGAVRRLTAELTLPVLVDRVEPIVPLSLREALAGTPDPVVILEIVLDATGRPAEPRVLKATHPALAAAGLLAVEQWRYEPARENGTPVPAFMVVRLAFKIAPPAPVAPPASSSATADFPPSDASATIAEFTRLEGEVKVKRRGAEDWEQARRGPLRAGDRVWAVTGVAEILHVASGERQELRPGTMVELHPRDAAGGGAAPAERTIGLQFGVWRMPVAVLESVVPAEHRFLGDAARELAVAGGVDPALPSTSALSPVTPDLVEHVERALADAEKRRDAVVVSRPAVLVQEGDAATVESTFPATKEVLKLRAVASSVDAAVGEGEGVNVGLEASLAGGEVPFDVRTEGRLPLLLMQRVGDEALLVLVQGGVAR